MRVNVESNMIVHFTQDKQYADQIIVETPWCAQMLPTPYTVGFSDLNFMTGMFKSESFRKLLTMYQEMKCDGMYTQINIAPSSSYNSIRCYTTWDRMANRVDSIKYQSYWPNDPYGKIKANCNEQGGRSRIFCPSKGSTAPLFCKCLPRSASEKTTFYPTASTANAVNFPAGSYGAGKQFWQIYTQSWIQDSIKTGFSPMIFIILENDQPTQQGGFNIQVQIKSTYYVTFRNPGVTTMDDSVYETLLKNNEELQPFTPEGGRVIEPDKSLSLQEALKENPLQPVAVTIVEKEDEPTTMDET